MTNEEIIENNILIAEFMNVVKVTSESSNHSVSQTMYSPYEVWYSAKELRYNITWDWLMEVVEKCTQIGYRDQEFDSKIYLKWEEIFDNQGMFLGNHIKEVWIACIQFIKWYNDNKGITTKNI